LALLLTQMFSNMIINDSLYQTVTITRRERPKISLHIKN
jgi:hypothetical protein